ncbi:MAG: class I SAM-dependent methyltransferase [Dehalococcoidia bacterium]|nr:class I SAM-dependent methyltransferase [Dehalococcoidia bacterium]
MGLLPGSAQILLDLSREHSFAGSLLTLGKQNVLVTPDQWRAMANPLGDIPTERHLRWNTDYITSDWFFKSLGFDAVASLDVSTYEGATYQRDLNKPGVSPWPGKIPQFDFVFDGSTIEHIFHLPNVLENIFYLLKPGGRVLHMSPSNHFMDDGFYQLSPTFFLDYYRANHWPHSFMYLHYMTANIKTGNSQTIIETADRLEPYDPAKLAEVSSRFWRHGDQLCETIFMATKAAGATYGCMPFQHRYAQHDYWRAGL